jgi:GDPmannose 4,6-dehydratase
MRRTAVVTGLTGQDGSILAEQLIADGIKVYGLLRRNSQHTLGCAQELGKLSSDDIEIVEGDITDVTSLARLCQQAKPDYFYNMAAQSHVGTSFNEPVHTAEVTGLGVLNCLEAIRLSGLHTRFLTASTSELYGGVSSDPANEETPFHPRSPYGVAKLFGYWATVNYREAYKMFACNTICFNHECERRGANFVTRKITLGVAAIKAGKQDHLALGNLDAKRDWGYAPDYTRGMRLVLETAANPDDFVLATGHTHSVREFCELAFSHAGLGDYQEYVIVDPRFYRPAEVDVLVGDYSKINSTLGWSPETEFEELVKRMVDHDLKR